AAPVAEVTADVQGLLKVLGSTRVVTCHPPDGSEAVEGFGLAEPVAEIAADVQGLLKVSGRSWVVARRPAYISEVGEGIGLAEPVAEVAVDPQGLLDSLGRARVIICEPQHAPEVVQGVGLAEPVAKVPRALACGRVASDGIGPRAVAPQQHGQGGGEADHPRVLAGPGGVVEAGQQAGTLSTGPRQR